MKLSAKSSFSVLTSDGIRSSGTRTASTWRTRLPNASRPVEGASSKSMKTRGPRLNAPMLRPGSLATTPRIVNAASPIVSESPTATPSAVSNSGRTSAPWFWRIACA